MVEINLIKNLGDWRLYNKNYSTTNNLFTLTVYLTYI